MQFLRERPRPFVYAVLVHLVLLAVLVFSLDWAPSTKPSTASKPAPVQAVVVDAERLDAEVQRQKAQKEKQQRQEQEKLKRIEEQTRAAERKREQEEKRIVELKHQREVQARKEAEAKQKAKAEAKRKAELAAKQKAEAAKKRQEEEKRKAEAEEKRQEEAKRKAEAEKKRQEEAKRKAAAEKKRQEEAERKAAEAEMQARLAAEQDRMATQRRSAMQRMIDEYVLYIQEKVQRSWIRPPSSGAGLSCTVEVRLIPSGEVIDAQIVRSSGNAAFDRSVEAAVFKASPLPVPPDAEVMEQFRSLRFEFKPGSA
ncbi:MAG: cell envelope integrity protein TolA [Thiogranum sp.]|nr:cell envelope integrity protein TolA [Thiogranum sp.]